MIRFRQVPTVNVSGRFGIESESSARSDVCCVSLVTRWKNIQNWSRKLALTLSARCEDRPPVEP